MIKSKQFDLLIAKLYKTRKSFQHSKIDQKAYKEYKNNEIKEIYAKHQEHLKSIENHLLQNGV